MVRGSVINVFLDYYRIDETFSPDWPKQEVTVGLPANWGEKPIGGYVIPIKKVIPKPDLVKTASLKPKISEMEK